MKVTLLIPTLNEIDGVKIIMPQIDPSWYDQILIVDGNSTDGTVEWLRETGYPVYIQKKDGCRSALFEALPQIQGDIVLAFSPDGNSPPEAIPLILEKMSQGYDLVIGSRYLGEAKSYDDSVITGLGNWIFTKTVNLLHGGKYTDAMVIYRAFKTSLIYELDLHKEEPYLLPERLFNTSLSWEPLMSVRAAKRKKKILEIPVDEPPRIGGESKMQPLRWGGGYYFQFIRELWYWK